jgi:hypothetical protein
MEVREAIADITKLIPAVMLTSSSEDRDIIENYQLGSTVTSSSRWTSSKSVKPPDDWVPSGCSSTSSRLE